MNEEQAQRVAELVKRAMKESGFTSVREAAAAWGMSVSGLRRLAAGRSAWPGATTVSVISRALGIKDQEFHRTVGLSRSRPSRADLPLGARVRELRCRLGLTQAQLDRLSGLGPGQVGNLESGKRRYVTREQVQALASALQVPESKLWAAIPGGASEARWIPLVR